MCDASCVHTSSVDKEITLTYDEWEKQVPAAITNDTLWRVQVYRLALFLAEIGMDRENPLLAYKIALFSIVIYFVLMRSQFVCRNWPISSGLARRCISCSAS